MGNLSRQPSSNEPQTKGDSSPWLGDNEFMDEVALLLDGSARDVLGVDELRIFVIWIPIIDALIVGSTTLYLGIS